MTSIFDSRSIFVTYLHGGSGTFVATLLQNLANNSFDNIAINDLGECVEGKTLLERRGVINEQGESNQYSPHWETQSLDKKAALVRDRAISLSSDIPVFPNTIVFKSHHTENIPVYKQLFPNLTIVNIVYCLDDHLVRELNACIKLTIPPLKERMVSTPFGFTLIEKHQSVLQSLTKFVPAEKVDILLSNINDVTIPINRDCRLFGYIRSGKIDYALRSNNTNIELLVIDGTLTFPFSIIRQNDHAALIHILKQVFPELTPQQEEYATRNLNKYYQKQIPELMENPRRFVTELEDRVQLYLKEYQK